MAVQPARNWRRSTVVAAPPPPSRIFPKRTSSLRPTAVPPLRLPPRREPPIKAVVLVSTSSRSTASTQDIITGDAASTASEAPGSAFVNAFLVHLTESWEPPPLTPTPVISCAASSASDDSDSVDDNVGVFPYTPVRTPFSSAPARMARKNDDNGLQEVTVRSFLSESVPTARVYMPIDGTPLCPTCCGSPASAVRPGHVHLLGWWEMAGGWVWHCSATREASERGRAASTFFCGCLWLDLPPGTQFGCRLCGHHERPGAEWLIIERRRGQFGLWCRRCGNFGTGDPRERRYAGTVFRGGGARPSSPLTSSSSSSSSAEAIVATKKKAKTRTKATKKNEKREKKREKLAKRAAKKEKSKAATAKNDPLHRASMSKGRGRAPAANTTAYSSN